MRSQNSLEEIIGGKKLKEKVVQVRRISKVVKGGKRLGFRVMVVIGDGDGHVGVGIRKAAEVPNAIRKGVESARKKQIKVPIIGTTIPHHVVGKFGASQILIKPAPRGTGVIAGGVARIILELAGVKDCVAKSIGSPNAINIARATLQGLSTLKWAEEESQTRRKKIESIFSKRDTINQGL